MTNKKKGMLPLAALVAVLAAVVVGLVVTLLMFHVVDFKFYKKNSETLDLTDREISVSHYEKLKAAMPACDISWNVPFQGGTLPDDTQEVTITTLTEEDVAALAYLPELKTVNARDCREYELLLYLQETYPQVKVEYQVLICGTYYDQDAETVKVTSATEEEILSLQYLPKVTQVVACGSAEDWDFTKLRNYCLNTGLDFGIQVGQDVIPYDIQEMTLESITDQELHLLQYVRGWEKLHLVNPQADAQKVLALRQEHPEAQITWEVDIAGQRYPDTTTEVDLSAVTVENLPKVEHAMSYLPEAELLILGLCGVDDPSWGNSKVTDLSVSYIENEDLAAYRDRVKDQYKVVWTVRLGPNIALRTDKDNFMPNHFGVGILTDEYAYNLRYCTDMVCLDVGHMTITHIEFVEYMPKLKYLILAWTNVKYIEPIRNCKELIFLELDNSAIRDISPLVDCTALEDVNIGNTWPDVTPLTQMPWLKNVYMIFGSASGAWQVSQALPDTRVVTSGNATVGGNWRRMQNYYDMRDMLNAPYMN